MLMRQFIQEERKEITIKILNAGEEYVLKTYIYQYRNLMALLNDNMPGKFRIVWQAGPVYHLPLIFLVLNYENIDGAMPGIL